jgi:hypothetical protein
MVAKKNGKKEKSIVKKHNATSSVPKQQNIL